MLDPVAKAGANFDFAFARRAPELPGKGLLFVLPVKGAKVLQAAQAAGLAKAEGIHTVRVEGANQPGTSADGTVLCERMQVGAEQKTLSTRGTVKTATRVV